MAKKINFTLEMADGYKVRYDLEEYRAHFDLVKAIEHFTSGKLIEWMENNLYEEIAESLGQLDKDSPDFPQRLCEILGVEMPETADEKPDIDAIRRTQEKEKTLSQKTSDEKIIANAAKTAFHRGDLVELLKAGEKTIYLCGDAFDIPIRKENVEYIGVLGTPKITIGTKSREELAEKNITFENVELPEELREIPASANVDKTVECPSEPSVKLAAPTRKYTVEELLEVAGKYHLKAYIGIASDGLLYERADEYGRFDNAKYSFEHGKEVFNFSARKARIEAALRKHDLTDNDMRIDRKAVLAQYFRICKTSEKTANFIKDRFAVINDVFREILFGEIEYCVALEIEPCNIYAFNIYAPENEKCVYTPDEIVELIRKNGNESDSQVGVSIQKRRFTVEELLEAAEKYHLKSFLGFGADDYGFGWVVNEIKHGNEFCDIDKREKKINAILRRNDVLDNSGEMSEAAVFHKFAELFEVSEKNAKYLETNINKLVDTIKAAILWQMKYMVALKLEPCDDPLDYGQDENAEWTLDTLYEAIS